MGRGSESQGRTDKAESRSSEWEDPRGAHSDSCAGNTAGSDDGHGPIWELVEVGEASSRRRSNSESETWG